MTDRNEAATPKLDRPGAGLPVVQEFVLRYLGFPLLKRFLTWERAVAVYEREGRSILALVADLGDEDLFRRVLVPRQVGIEDSSRYWSPGMTLEHLLIVSEGVLTLMAKLGRGEVIETVVDTALVKPAEETQPDIKRRYRSYLRTFPNRLSESVADRAPPNCHVHPWFGCLNTHGWLVMLAVHQWIHRKQLEQICKRL